MKRVLFAVLLFGAAVSMPLAAQRGSGDTPIADRAKGAERVVVATVIDVTAEFATSDFGDQLIVSHAQLRVEESLKGTGPSMFVLDVEGGTVGNLTLRVSDMPTITTGERAVFFVGRSASGRPVPHLGERGVLKLDKTNRVDGTSVSLADVKRQVGSGR